MNQWYYGENGQQCGPVDDAEFAALIANQTISSATLVWKQGMPGWIPYAQVKSGANLAQSYGPAVSMLHPATSGYAIASLVLGIVGLVSCMVFLGIPGIIFGHMALSQIAKSSVPMVGRGMAIAGLVCSYLTTLIFLGFIGLFIFGIASTSSFP